MTNPLKSSFLRFIHRFIYKGSKNISNFKSWVWQNLVSLFSKTHDNNSILLNTLKLDQFDFSNSWHNTKIILQIVLQKLIQDDLRYSSSPS